MNIATLTPIQAGPETDHDQLEFDFVARLRRVGNLRATLTTSNQLTLRTGHKLQIMQNSAISNSAPCNSGVDARWSNWKSALLDIIDANIPKARVNCCY